MVVPAPLFGVFGYPCLDFVRDFSDELIFIVFWRVIAFEADDDAFFFAPRAEGDDACAHVVHFLREPQVECAGAAE